MQLISKYNKGVRFLLCVVDIFSKYAWVVPLKDKKGVSIAPSISKYFKTIQSKTKQNMGSKGSEFYNNFFKNDYKTMILICIRHKMKENLMLQKDSLEH